MVKCVFGFPYSVEKKLIVEEIIHLYTTFTRFRKTTVLGY